MGVKCLRKPPAARAKCLRALPAHRPTRDVESTLGEEGLARRWVLTRPDVTWFNGVGNTAASWTAAVDADDRPFGDRRRAEALLAQVNAGFGGDLLKALTQYPLVATDTGHLLDGWHRLYLWVKSGLPGGPPTLVLVPGKGGLGAAPDAPWPAELDRVGMFEHVSKYGGTRDHTKQRFFPDVRYVLKQVPTASLHSDLSDRPDRLAHPPTAARLAEYAAQPANTAPPILIDFGNHVWDGHHRVYAAQQRGDPTILAYQMVAKQKPPRKQAGRLGKGGLGAGPPTLVLVPGSGGLGTAPGTEGLLYRGITQDEHDFIVTHGYIQSNERYCIRGEGTCFAFSYDDAEGYVNYGRTNPITTKSPTYVLAVSSGGDVVVDPRDGYPKVAGHVASDRIKVAYRFNPDGTMERGVWSPTGFSSRSKPKPHPWRKSPTQWGVRPGLGRVSDLCTGRDLGRQVWDYTCVLSPAQRKEGYTLRVEIGPSGNYIRTSLHHPGAPHDKQLRQGEVGFVSGVRSGKTLVVGESFLTESFRGRGLGMSLYEALYSRAQAMGAKAVAGTAHSTPASMLHRKMAEKHELKYQPVPNYGAQTDNWETEAEWEAAPSGAYDEKWRAYHFPLNGAPAPDREAMFSRFKDAVRYVWRSPDFVLPVIALSPEGPSNPVLASITFNPQGVWASGNSLLRRAPQYTVRFADRLLTADPETQWKILVHEAVHLGYPRHDRGFRDLCRAKGGSVSEEALDGQGIKAEKKIGSRFQVQRVFTDEKEATRWTKEQQRAEPGSRWRLSLGGVGGTVPFPPEFWRWFKNSKVVNADGSPRIVYHGTTRNFERFKLMGRGMGGAIGFWFASNPAALESFTRQRTTSDAPQIVPVYLSLQTPAVYEGWSSFVEAVRAKGKPVLEANLKALRNSLIRSGHDGIIVLNSDTDGGGVRDDFVAFEPTQIKSAVGNRGTFDPGDPSILHGVGPGGVTARGYYETDRMTMEQKLYGPIQSWKHYPDSDKKTPLLAAYASLTPREKLALEASVKTAFIREHGGEEAVMYRYKSHLDDPRGKSLTAEKPPASFKQASFRIRPEQVMVHYGQDEFPLGAGMFKHEKEVILRPDGPVPERLSGA